MFLIQPPPPPAQVLQVPAPKGLDELQVLLQAIPEAFVQGRARTLPGLVAKARAGWDARRAGLRGAVPEAEAGFITKQLKAMSGLKPREQAVGALGIATTLGRFQTRGARLDRLQADRAALLAWCAVDAGQWEPQPRLAEAYRPALEADRGRNPLGAIGVETALKRVEEAWKGRRAPGAKKALADLLKASEAFGKG